MIVSQFSCGAASAVATKLVKDAEAKYYRMLESVEELARLKGERASKLRFN